jgi:hypothetical protein
MQGLPYTIWQNERKCRQKKEKRKEPPFFLFPSVSVNHVTIHSTEKERGGGGKIKQGSSI